MANLLVEKVDEVVSLVEKHHIENDKRLEELEKGNKARADEQAQKVARMEADLQKLIKERNELQTQAKNDHDRIEMLEALSDRPRMSPQEKIQKEYADLFFKGIRTAFKDNEVTSKMRHLAEKSTEYKDVTIASNIGGGYGVPKEIAAAVDKLVLNLSGIVSNVKMVQTGTSDYQELISIFGGTSAWITSETTTRTATGTPNLRNCKPTWGELYAYPVVSEWSLQDIFFDVTNWLTNDIADGMAVALSTAIATGNGSAKPTGMLNTSTAATADYASPMRAAAAYEHIILTSLTSPVKVNMDSIIALVYKVRPPYRGNGKFAMNSVTQGYVRTLKASTAGTYLWEPSLQVGQPDRLLGYPVFTWEDLGNPTTDAATAVGFGDWQRAYTLAYRTELMVMQEGFTAPGFVKFYARRRFGGIPTNNDSVKFLKVSD